MENYLIQPDYHAERLGDENLFEAAEPWENVTNNAEYNGRETCGNLSMYIAIDKKTKTVVDTSPDLWKFDGPTTGMYGAISSAFLMYKIACLIGGPINIIGPEGYKCIWHVTLLHKKTGKLLTFYDYKGAASFGGEYVSENQFLGDNEEFPKAAEAYINDFKTLLNALLSDKCPHPYDGIVAGGVA